MKRTSFSAFIFGLWLKNDFCRVAERFFCFLSNRIAFFVISYGFNFSLMIFNNPVSKWFCAIFVIYILTPQRLTIKEKFNAFAVCISLYINQLAFVPVPVRKKMYKRLHRFSCPFRFKKIVSVFWKACCINLAKERRF